MKYKGQKVTDHIIHRLFARIFIQKNGCWIWEGSKDGCGYGTLAIGTVRSKTHRLMFLITHGYLTSKLEICHSCDTPACANPDHLEEKSHKENIQDCVKRKRTWKRNGEKNPRNVLKAREVQKIRIEYKKRINSYRKLAKKYGVGKTTISHIIKRRTWQKEQY